jgi:hypothetical protein
MVPLYLIVGTLLCSLFIYAGLNGWKILDPNAAGSSKPHGPGQHYHK